MPPMGIAPWLGWPASVAHGQGHLLLLLDAIVSLLVVVELHGLDGRLVRSLELLVLLQEGADIHELASAHVFAQ
eukprot:6864565-Alexandrium_andersonii.AAC.1